jgi:TPR repeat protein
MIRSLQLVVNIFRYARETVVKKTYRLFCISIFLVLGVVLPALGFNGMDSPLVKQQAEKGDPDAQSKLGVLYASGVGMKMDKKEAVKWYRKAADQGYPVAQWNLAFMYVRGEGVEQSYPEALALFRKAAEAGFENAQYDLGMMYLQGLAVKEDRAEARRWFLKAADQGYKDAAKMLKELDKE